MIKKKTGGISMNEIEVKILNIDIDQIREKLKDIGALLVKKENQINYMYDFPGEPLYKNYKGFCRIRDIESMLDKTRKYILGVKKMISQEQYKIMKEEETEVFDLESTKNILVELGMINVRTDIKYRESYKYDGVLYEIDIWDKDIYPHPYLEVEAKDEKSLNIAIELLGFDLNQTTTKNLKELREDLGLTNNVLEVENGTEKR